MKIQAKAWRKEKMRTFAPSKWIKVDFGNGCVLSALTCRYLNHWIQFPFFSFFLIVRVLRGFYIKRKPSGQRERNPRISVDFITTLLPFKLSWILSVTYGIVVFGWTTASCCGKDFSVSGTHRKSIWKKIKKEIKENFFFRPQSD